jgi:hypothetical protein
MSIFDILLDTLFVGLALIMLLVSFLSYKRHLNRKLALVSASFLLYSLLAICVLVSTLFNWSSTQMSVELVLFNIGILLLQYLSMVRS